MLVICTMAERGAATVCRGEIYCPERPRSVAPARSHTEKTFIYSLYRFCLCIHSCRINQILESVIHRHSLLACVFTFLCSPSGSFPVRGHQKYITFLEDGKVPIQPNLIRQDTLEASGIKVRGNTSESRPPHLQR